MLVDKWNLIDLISTSTRIMSRSRIWRIFTSSFSRVIDQPRSVSRRKINASSVNQRIGGTLNLVSTLVQRAI